jgi:hypothetical protein
MADLLVSHLQGAAVPGNNGGGKPFDKGDPISFRIRHGGYYRTPSLINVWATAPFFENNMLGAYTGDPSVKGRLTAFNDAAEKLLWPEKRLGKRTVKVTGKDSVLKIRDIEIRIPAGAPVDLLANINIYRAVQVPEVAAQLNRLLSAPNRLVRLVHIMENNGQYDSELRLMVPSCSV